MAVQIGHASTDGKPQASQVLIANYYSGGWNCVLRPKSAILAKKSAEICEAGCDNNKIGYSQGKRNTLRDEALKKAGFKTSSYAENLKNVTVQNVKDITTRCWADCSSFMTFCAMCGGADIKYGIWSDNAHVVSSMEESFTENDVYVALKAKTYLNSSDYLRRGDILLNSGHTVMVLSDGAKADEDDWVYEDAITAIEIKVSLKDITDSSLKAVVSLYKIEAGEELKMNDTKERKAYDWKYQLIRLDQNSSSKTKSLKVKKQSNTFVFDNLVSGVPYALQVTAVEKNNEREYVSAKKIFTTNHSFPKPVSDLTATFNSEKLNKISKVTLNFSPPKTWGTSSFPKCYRTYLFINGITYGFSDTLIANNSSGNVDINLKSFGDLKNKLKFDDCLQIGVQTGILDSGYFKADINTLKCTKAFYLRNNSCSKFFKIFTKINKQFKLTMLHKQER